MLRGYFGAEQVLLRALKPYQLFVLLDRWSATVTKRVAPGAVRSHLHAGGRRVDASLRA